METKNYELKKNNEVLKAGTMEEVLRELVTREDNGWRALNHYGYDVFCNGEKITVEYEQEQEADKLYRREVYFKRLGRLVEIVKALGYKPEPREQEGTNGFYYPDNVHVLGKNNSREISLSIGYNSKGKAEIRGVYKTNNYNSPKPSICFNFDKPIEKIKKDIERRFMPEFEKAVNFDNEQLRVENEHSENLAEAVTYLKKDAKDEEKKSGQIYFNYKDLYSVRVSSKSSVSLDINTDYKTAKKIIELLKTK